MKTLNLIRHVSLLSALLVMSNFATAQDIIIPPTQEPVPVANPVAPGGNQTGNVNTGGQAPEVAPGEQVTIELSDDTRNQGFVGATGNKIQEFGYVGAASEISGPTLSEGADFGGGVNSGGGGGRGGATTLRGGQAAFGFGGQQNGFPVVRRSVRTKLSRSFDAPAVPGQVVTNRFNEMFYRIPATRQFAGQFNVVVSDRTATITGAVGSQRDADAVIRQLQLEPGIYKIDNQLKIGQ